jgi:hypothetical protein
MAIDHQKRVRADQRVVGGRIGPPTFRFSGLTVPSSVATPERDAMLLRVRGGR